MFRACNFARAILMVALLFDASSVEAQPSAAIGEFDRGRQLITQERYEEALAAFRRSHELFPSPNSLLMAGRALRALGRLAEARHALRAAEREAAVRQTSEPRYQEAEAAAREEGAELDAQIARARIRLDGADEGELEIRVGDRALEPGATDDILYLDPGLVRITGVREGEVVAEAELEARAGVDHDVVLVVAAPVVAAVAEVEQEPPSGELAPPAQPLVDEQTERSVLAPLGWTALALGLASAGLFGGLYATTDAHYHDRCAMGCSEAGASEGRTLEALTNTFFVSALVLVPLGVASLVIAQLEAGSVEVALGPTSAWLRGTF